MADRSVAYVFKGNFSNLSAGLAIASKNTKELGSKLTGLDKQSRQMRSGLTTVADGAGKIGLLAAGSFAVAVGSAAKFEQAISHVSAATHESAGNMKLLRQAALDAGQATQYSATEAAGAIEELAKAGVSTSDILAGGLDGALSLAAAGAIDVGEAAEVAATALVQFRLEGNQVEHVADLLAAGAGKAQGSVSDLGMALKQSGLVASQMGLSVEDTTGALSAMASAGLIGSDAGTSLKSALLALQSPTKKSADLMASLGITAYDAQGNFVGLTDLSGQLTAAFKDKSQAERDAALSTIFGSDAIRTANVLYNQGATGIQGWIDKTNDAGYAAETAATRMDNLAGDFEKLKGSLETALIGAGDGSQGPLRSLVQGLDGAVNAFNGLPPAAQSTTTALLGITAITGGSLWFGSKVINGVADTRQALSDLGYTGSKTAGVLGRVGRVAGVAAIGIGAFGAAVALANETDPAAGIEANTKAILDLADGADAATAQIDQIFSRESSSFSGPFEMKSEIDGLGDALKKLDTGSLKKLWSDPIFMDSDWDLAAESVGNLDDAMASLVSGGNAPQAAAMFEYFSKVAKDVGYSTDDIADRLPRYTDALVGVENATEDAGAATQDYGVAARTSEEAVGKLNKSIEKQRDAARGTAKSFVGLGDSLDDSKVSLSEWIKSLQEQADALRDFRVNAEQAGKKGLKEGLVKELEAAGPAGAMRMKQLAGATKEQIGAANRSWQAGQREIRKYTDAVGGVPVSTGTRVDVKTFDAMSAIARLRAALEQVKSKDVSVNVHYRNIGNKLAGMAVGREADGGTVPKTGLPYADRHPYLLADGERVTSNRYGQSDKATHLLDLINAGRLTDKMVGYADGGTAGGKPGGKPAGKDFTYAVSRGDSTELMTVGRSAASVTAAIAHMRDVIRGLSQDVKDASKAVRRETRERDVATASVTVAQAEVDRLTGLYDTLSGTIQSGLAANQFATVPGVTNADPWASSTASTEDRAPTIEEILAALNTSTVNANAFTAASGSLSQSLSGAALQSVLEQGLETVQTFAGLSEAQLAQYQADYDANATAVGRAGTSAGAVYGEDMGRANQILDASLAEQARQTAELASANAAAARAEKQRDRAEKQRDQMQGVLSDLHTEIKKARGDLESGARGRR